MSIDLRNIGVIAHIDAGKTTVTERMLFYSGFSHRVGEVDKGTTVTDYDPEEQERGITINSACVRFDWEVKTIEPADIASPKIQVNLIDTPGHVDFTAEVERSLRVLDGGVVVFSAREGVEAQSETVWHQADKYRVPRLAFINKMDREGADFFGTLDEIRTRLDCRPLPLNLPVGAGPPHVKEAFRGIIDLISMQCSLFPMTARPPWSLPAKFPRNIATRPTLALAASRPALALQRRTYGTDAGRSALPASLLHKVIRNATLHGMIVPVFCGSALDGIGVQPVLDAVAAVSAQPGRCPAGGRRGPKEE